MSNGHFNLIYFVHILKRNNRDFVVVRLLILKSFEPEGIILIKADFL